LQDKLLIVEDNFFIRKNLRLKHEEKPEIWPKSRDIPCGPGSGYGQMAGSGLPALPQRVPSWRSFTLMPLACL